MQFLEISWDFGILGFSDILGFFQRLSGIFDEVYEDFQSNLPLDQQDSLDKFCTSCAQNVVKHSSHVKAARFVRQNHRSRSCTLVKLSLVRTNFLCPKARMTIALEQGGLARKSCH